MCPHKLNLQSIIDRELRDVLHLWVHPSPSGKDRDEAFASVFAAEFSRSEIEQQSNWRARGDWLRAASGALDYDLAQELCK
jgi:hypothetical protein